MLNALNAINRAQAATEIQRVVMFALVTTRDQDGDAKGETRLLFSLNWTLHFQLSRILT